MARLLRNFFCFMVLFCSLTFQASQILQTLGRIGKAQPISLFASFLTFFAAAAPNFAMAAYQLHNNSSIDLEGKSKIVKFLYPFVLRLDEEGYTINPTTLSSKEYFSIGLGLSALSFFYLIVGGVFTKLEETYGSSPSSDSRVMNGRAILDGMHQNDNAFFGKNCSKDLPKDNNNLFFDSLLPMPKDNNNPSIGRDCL